MQRPRRWLAFPADAFSAQVRTSDIEDQLKPNLKHNISSYWNSLKLVCVEPAIGGRELMCGSRCGDVGSGRGDGGTKCILCLALSSELVNRMHRTKCARPGTLSPQHPMSKNTLARDLGVATEVGAAPCFDSAGDGGA